MNIKYSRAYSDGAELKDGILTIENDYFTAAANGSIDLDLTKYRVFPGFIDMHTHGGAGIDSMKASFEELDALSLHYASCGVATFNATTVTNTMDATLSAIKTISARIDAGTNGANIGGIYLEGPYLAAKFRGAHEESLLREILLDEVKTLIDAGAGHVKVIAIAPEKENALDAISYISSRGVQVALGHSAATQTEAEAAINAGAHITIHTYNAMAGLNHRNVGLLGTSLLRDDVYNELICDLIHVCPEALKLVMKCKNPKNVVLITDSMDAAGMPDGNYLLGRLPVKVENSIARTEEGALAGSTLKANVALKNVVETLGIPVCTAAMMLTCNPANALGMHDIGSLSIGKRGHLTALDEDYNVVLTIVDGKIVIDNR